MKLIRSIAEINLPEAVRCPICGMRVVIDEVSEWEEDEQGRWRAESVKITCETEPDLDAQDFLEWLNEHFSMPYVDWLPLEIRVRRWVNRNYRWNLYPESEGS